MKIVAELPLDEVLDHCLSGGQGGMYTYNDQGDQISVKRLTQFAVHGVKCHFCGLEGDRVLVTCDNGGGLHADVYAGQTMMNRDHILPASKGGKATVWNFRPTCSRCNSRRGNTYNLSDKRQYRFNKHWSKWHMRIWGTGVTNRKLKYSPSKVIARLTHFPVIK